MKVGIQFGSPVKETGVPEPPGLATHLRIGNHRYAKENAE
jgi:hypothetical protein